ncbi:hypothetical protein [Celeribacter neptunius]|uniref:Flp pilus assembly protein, pilin Flp n=1 Tax=Celeribacter neptunius TaxID=588602 RepID=A0A1I3ITX0_9RHOB|nr:hypothetical protein [Celeribacter neptunius]SFI51352.1 hypothetical protein SAMN04487991_0133 [Celeribacter neptunius]
MMNLKKTARRFWTRDEGAVTVDWVVLVSAVVGLSIPIVAMIYDGMDVAAGNINDTIATMSVTRY